VSQEPCPYPGGAVEYWAGAKVVCVCGGLAWMARPTAVAEEATAGWPKGYSRPKDRPAEEEPDVRLERPDGCHAAGCAHHLRCCRCCHALLCLCPPFPCHHPHGWMAREWTGRTAKCQRRWRRRQVLMPKPPCPRSRGEVKGPCLVLVIE
jgi:hypothetical protein